MYGPEWTIEAAAEDLALHAKAMGLLTPGPYPRRAALFVDSIQQVTCDAMLLDADMSERQVVNANVRAVRSVASLYRMFVAATSEMNRNAYRNIEAAEQSNDMAAAKESGAIEFSARVMLALRSVKGQGDLVQVRMVKNKHGPSYPAVDDFFLALDRGRQTLTMAEAPKAEPGKAAKTQARKAEHVTAAARVAEYLAAHPGGGARDIRSALRRAMGTCPTQLADDAVALLVEAGAIVAPDVGRGQARPHWLVGPKVPSDVLAHVSLERRPVVSVAAPPPQEAK
jgi:hypothetical protein